MVFTQNLRFNHIRCKNLLSGISMIFLTNCFAMNANFIWQHDFINFKPSKRFVLIFEMAVLLYYHHISPLAFCYWRCQVCYDNRTNRVLLTFTTRIFIYFLCHLVFVLLLISLYSWLVWLL